MSGRWLTTAEQVAAVDEVAVGIARSIETGQLPPGRVLTLNEVCASYGAGRDVAEAALHRLETDGLTERRGNSLIVPELDAGELRRLNQMRRSLEMQLLVECAPRFTVLRRHRVAQMMWGVHRSIAAGRAQVAPGHPKYAGAAALRTGRLRSLPLSPAAGSWEYRTLEHTWAMLTRYLTLGRQLAFANDGSARSHTPGLVTASLHAFEYNNLTELYVVYHQIIDHLESYHHRALAHYGTSARIYYLDSRRT